MNRFYTHPILLKDMIGLEDKVGSLLAQDIICFSTGITIIYYLLYLLFLYSTYSNYTNSY